MHSNRSKHSSDLAYKTVRSAQPDAVMVELCKYRMSAATVPGEQFEAVGPAGDELLPPSVALSKGKTELAKTRTLPYCHAGDIVVPAGSSPPDAPEVAPTLGEIM